MKFRLSLLEIFLLETVVWLGLWLLNDYLATLLTFILGAIVSAVLIIALISEGIERSKVPKKYFQIMIISVLAPIVSAILYMLVFGARPTFIPGG